MKTIRRMIAARRYYRPTNLPHSARDSVIIDLICGHDRHYKGSGEPKQTTIMLRCKDCERNEGRPDA